MSIKELILETLRNNKFEEISYYHSCEECNVLFSIGKSILNDLLEVILFNDNGGIITAHRSKYNSVYDLVKGDSNICHVHIIYDDNTEHKLCSST